ncbi:NmrA/HSCARG family protein [Allokutzneria oryzae]|uniref:NmrA/HSCARG family protein n=1 Tax=Allokutzneria oryzae TaxID=1378989 RepID=A0ABV6A1G8_9PSEU
MKLVLVSGATGRQGGAAVTHLLADGWRVRALVRDPDAPAARALAEAGAELARGDLDDTGSLAAAVTGAHGVFGVTPDDADLARETRRGRNLVDAAAAAGVAHFVFTSVGGADRNAGIGYWESKWAVEQHIHAVGLPATVLRPVRFMENHAIPGIPLGGIVGDTLVHLFAPDSPVQLIAVDDIGRFAALAFAHPEDYVGKALELAGDELSPNAAAAMISSAVGREIGYRQVPAGDLMPEETARTFASSGRVWQADIPALRALHPGLLDFPAWLANGGADRIRDAHFS